MYAPIHAGIWHSLKLRRLVRALGAEPNEAVARIFRVIHQALMHAPDGRWVDRREDDVDELAGVPAGTSAAMVATGWMHVVGGELTMHEWGEYGGRGLNLRAGNRERKRRERDAAREATGPGRSHPGHADESRQSRARGTELRGEELRGTERERNVNVNVNRNDPGSSSQVPFATGLPPPGVAGANEDVDAVPSENHEWSRARTPEEQHAFSLRAEQDRAEREAADAARRASEAKAAARFKEIKRKQDAKYATEKMEPLVGTEKTKELIALAELHGRTLDSVLKEYMKSRAMAT